VTGRDAGFPLDRLGVVPGTPATLVQFSSAFCAPCLGCEVYLLLRRYAVRRTS
jgi:hypothetical protein